MTSDSVLIVTHPLAPASESHVEALLNIFAAITSVALITANLSSDSTIREQYEVIELSDEGATTSIIMTSGRYFCNQLRMCYNIAMRNEDTILFFGATSYIIPIAFARVTGRTVVLEPRGNVPLTLRLKWKQQIPAPAASAISKTVWILEQVGYRLADGIITYTPSMAEELGVDRFENKLYASGARYINTDHFSPQIPYEERKQNVGFIGRLDEEKNVRTLAAVAKTLPEEITFRFIGDGELRSEIERSLADEIEKGTVRFTGWIDHEEIPKELSKLRLLVLPSEPTEGLPTVILEALGCGTPVLAAPVSGVPDIVFEDETGFLLNSTQKSDIRNKIIETLRQNNLSQISIAGRDHICNKYNFKSAVNRYENIIESIDNKQ